MAIIADLIALGAPTTWLDNVDNTKTQPGDAADATRPDIWTYEGLKWSSSVGPNGEPGFDIMDSYGTDWRFCRVRFSDLGTIAAVDGDVWDATVGCFTQRHFVDAGAVGDMYGLLGAGMDLLEVHSGDERTDLGTIALVNIVDPDNTQTTYELSISNGLTTNTAAARPMSEILGKYVEFKTQWTNSATTSSADGSLSVAMRVSDDGNTWTDLGVLASLSGINTATSPAAYRSGSTVYGMTVILGNIGIPGACYYAVLRDTLCIFEPPTPGPYEEQEDHSDPCCGSGSSSPTQGQTGEIPVVNPNGPYNPGPSTTTCVGGGTVPTAADLTDPEDWRALQGVTPDVLVELHATKHPSTLGETVYRWATKGLDLPIDEAFVEGRVRKHRWLEIRRAMALPDQYPEVSRAGVEIDEQDGLIRTLLDTESTSYLLGREYIQWLVSETRRKASGTMAAIFRGVVSAFNPGAGRTYVLEAEDQITSPFGVFNLDTLLPQALIDHVFFGPGGDGGEVYAPAAPTSATPAPTLIGAGWRGAALVDGVWTFGRAEMTPPGPDPPDSLTLTELTGGTIPAGPYRVTVWGVTAGVAGDPEPFNYHGEAIDVTGDSASIDVDWVFGGSDPDEWKIALAPFYFRARWQDGQVLTVTGSARTATFTSFPALTPGAVAATDHVPPRNYRVLAVMPDGLTEASIIGVSSGGPYDRPAHVSWVPVSGALGYQVFYSNVQFPQPNDFKHRKDAPADQIDTDGYGYIEDDWLGTGWVSVSGLPGSSPLAGQLLQGAHKDLVGTPIPILGSICSDRGATAIDGQSAEKGAVPLIWTRDVHLPGHGDRVFGELLVGLGELAAVEDVFASDLGYDNGVATDPPRAPKRINMADRYGIDVFTPAHEASWPFETSYRERTVGDQTLRYTAIYMDGERMQQHRDGIITATANVCGPMGVNGNVITQVGPFLQWFYNEHVAANNGEGYRSGEYHTLATYASDATVPYLNPLSFAAFQTYTEGRIAGGYLVQNFQLRERLTLREVERRFMEDFEVSLPFNRYGQKFLAWIDDLADPTDGTLYRERLETDEPLPPYVDAHDEIENEVGFKFDYDHDLGTFAREAEFLRDENSIAAHGGVMSGGRRLSGGQTVSPLEVYSTADAATVRDAKARRLLRKRKAPRYQEIPSDLFALTDDIASQVRLTHTRGVGASGYQERPFKVLEQRHDPNRHGVTLRAMDLAPLVYGVGAWTEDSAQDWDDESAVNQAGFSFWADDDSTIPSDDVAAKEWR